MCNEYILQIELYLSDVHSFLSNNDFSAYTYYVTLNIDTTKGEREKKRNNMYVFNPSC